MFTSFDKALVALVMGIVFMINNFTGFHFAVDEGTINGVAGVLTPLLTYFWPNKTAG